MRKLIEGQYWISESILAYRPVSSVSLIPNWKIYFCFVYPIVEIIHNLPYLKYIYIYFFFFLKMYVLVQCYHLGASKLQDLLFRGGGPPWNLIGFHSRYLPPSRQRLPSKSQFALSHIIRSTSGTFQGLISLQIPFNITTAFQ